MHVVELQHAKLAVGRMQQMRANLTKLHKKFNGQLIVGTGNSGTDLVLNVLTDLVQHWETVFGLHFEVVHAFSCDHGAQQQQFIQAHFEPGCLFQDMEELATGDKAFDVLSGLACDVPSVCMFVTGIECDTLAQCNQQKRIGASVVLNAEGKTGKSANHTMDYVTATAPDFLLFECVKGLASAPKQSGGNGTKLSDLDLLILTLNKHGYIFWTGTLDALSFGFPTARERCYALGIRVKPPSEEFSQLPKTLEGQTEPVLFEFPVWWHELHNLFQELRLDAPLPISRFLLQHCSELRSRWKQFPGQGSVDKPMMDNKKSKSSAVAAPEWETDHLTAFQERGLPWPPNFSNEFTDKTSHLCRRKAEIVWYYENTESSEELVDALCDINFSIAWSKLTHGRTACLVGSSHVWCFGRSFDSDFGTVDGIDLAGEEALALQGFSLQAQNQEVVSTMPPADP